MSRKKTKKGNVNRKAESNSATNLPQLEKAFFQTPAVLVGELTKQVAALKRKEAQLQTDAVKAKKSADAATKQVSASKKAAHTVAGKKQLVKAKKALADALKLQTALQKQVKEAAKSVEAASNKLAKTTELRKYLSQFDAVWSKLSKAAAKKRKLKSKTAAKKASTHDTSRDEFEQPAIDHFETLVSDNAALDGTVKSSS